MAYTIHCIYSNYCRCSELFTVEASAKLRLFRHRDKSMTIKIWNSKQVLSQTLAHENLPIIIPGKEIKETKTGTKSRRTACQPIYIFFFIRWFSMATSGTKPIIVSAGHVYILLHQREKWGSTIQYGYRKRGTHARVFSQTLTHGNSKNEIRQWDRWRHTEEMREYGKNYSGHE